MQCLSPINIADPRRGGKYRLVVPCGKCYACLDRKRTEWTIRLREELKISTSALFVTLTYSDEYIPINDCGFPSVSKSDCQKFLKLLRYYSPGCKIRYYLTSEYGGTFLRPHYHAVIFNLNTDAHKAIEKAWPKGQIHIGSVTDASIHYVTKYCINKSACPEGSTPVFSLMSRNPGLGQNYIDSKKNYHIKDRFFYNHQGGLKTSLPRYYKERLYDDFDRQMHAKDCELLALKKYDKLQEKYPQDNPYLMEKLEIQHYNVVKKNEIDKPTALH